MIERFFAVYVRTLFVIEVLLFASSLLLHVAELVWVNKPIRFEHCSVMLFAATWMMGFAITPFRKRSNWEWVNEIKQCPEWMWKGALGFGIYTFVVAGTALLNGARPGSETISAFLIAFNAISGCLIYSTICSEPTEKFTLIRQTRNSLIGVSVAAIFLVALNAGYLPLRTQKTSQGSLGMRPNPQ